MSKLKVTYRQMAFVLVETTCIVDENDIEKTKKTIEESIDHLKEEDVHKPLDKIWDLKNTYLKNINVLDDHTYTPDVTSFDVEEYKE